MSRYLTHIREWFRHRRLYVIADDTDNSVTLSRALFRKMGVMEQDAAKVFVFRVGDSYAFTLNPELEQPTQLADIQYNAKYRCVGFETLNPTVSRIFYDYRLPAGIRCKLSVDKCSAVGGMIYYKILRPDAVATTR